MRRAFVETLCAMAADDPRILLLTGDLGYMALEPFRDRFPARFFNCGVAEQNMIGVAAGLAEAGFRPYAYSIATFAALRAFEFIRNGPVAHRLPVRIVGMGMGFDYSHAGPTHYALEDIAAMRTLPGLAVVVPGDSKHAANALLETKDLPGPVYYSLSKNDGLALPVTPHGLEIRPGNDIAIVTMGSIAGEALAAADLLQARGISASVALVSSFNPDPVDELREYLRRFPVAISLEAQIFSGGLGAFAASVIATGGLRCALRILAVRESPDGTSGSVADRWRRHGLDRLSLVNAALEMWGRE